jgi:hypothetical protein
VTRYGEERVTIDPEILWDEEYRILSSLRSGMASFGVFAAIWVVGRQRFIVGKSTIITENCINNLRFEENDRHICDLAGITKQRFNKTLDVFKRVAGESGKEPWLAVEHTGRMVARSRFFFFGQSPRLMPEGWQITRRRIFARDNYTCQYCGATNVPLACDHRLPHSRGGSNEPENLVTACVRCNSRKHTKTPEEWQR